VEVLLLHISFAAAREVFEMTQATEQRKDGQVRCFFIGQTQTDKNPALLKRPQVGERLSLQRDRMVKASKWGSDSK